MTKPERREELLQNILRLRSASRRRPDDHELAQVRLSLERDLGDAVSQRLAARTLGVSHTALQRWIKSGDLPLVLTASGQAQVPVQALLGLYEAAHAGEHPARLRYPLTPTMMRQREAAESIPRQERRSRGRDHEAAVARGLAYHRVVARRLRRPMVQEARHTLRRWRDQERIDPHYAEEWERLLDRPIREIRREIVSEDQRAHDLRQNSPFAGTLSEPERRRALRAG
jgi:hypothetical protein